MRALFLNILPQVMVLVGLAGMAWILAKNGSPFRHVLDMEKVRRGADAAKRIAAERGVQFAEKALRTAKILAMRLERFFSAGLEAIAAHKKGADAAGSFWRSVRERKIILRKSARRRSSPAEELSPGTTPANEEEVLARFAKERDEAHGRR